MNWTGERIARLGFLMGLGWDANRVAKDPIIASTPNNVHRHAHKFGLSFRAAATMSCPLPPENVAPFEVAAAKRLLTSEEIIRLLLLEIAGDPTLIDNILDDAEEIAA